MKCRPNGPNKSDHLTLVLEWMPLDTWRKNNVIITSERRVEVVWRNNDVIVASRVRWVMTSSLSPQTMSLRSSRRETQLSSSQTLTRERVRHQRSLSSSRAQSSTHGSRGSNLDVSRVTGGGRGDDRITLNVGGLRYQTTKGTLLRVPNSVLTELAENALRTEEPGVNYEYFFDRSPALFPAILDYYRLRELHLDHAVCPRLLQQELEFWKIPESALADCCWARYAEFFEKQHTRKKLDQVRKYEQNHVQVRCIYHLSYHPNRSANKHKWTLIVSDIRYLERPVKYH